jgi:hypothetical protein
VTDPGRVAVPVVFDPVDLRESDVMTVPKVKIVLGESPCTEYVVVGISKREGRAESVVEWSKKFDPSAEAD